MDLKKFNQNAINCIYKTAQIALSSISNVLEELDNVTLKEELKKEYEGYESFTCKLTTFIKENEYELKEVNPMKKAIMWTSIKLNTLTNDSGSHIASLMIKGTVTGITEMQELINGNSNALDQNIVKYAKELKELMEKYEQDLKKYL